MSGYLIDMKPTVGQQIAELERELKMRQQVFPKWVAARKLKRLQENRRVGALGDSYPIDVIIDTPANKEAVEAAGLRPWAEAVIDDSLWVE